MAEAKLAVTKINPDDFLKTDHGRVWTPERNEEAWIRSYEALSLAIANAGRKSRVIIVCGVQGVGKTTWIAAQPVTDAVIYFDAALPGARHRAAIVDIARRAGAAVEAVWVLASLETALKRNACRPLDEVVPAAAIHAVASQFEEPTLSEGFERVRIIDADDALSHDEVLYPCHT